MKLLRQLYRIAIMLIILTGWFASIAVTIYDLFTGGNFWDPLAVAMIGYFGMTSLYLQTRSRNPDPILRRIDYGQSD